MKTRLISRCLGLLFAFAIAVPGIPAQAQTSSQSDADALNCMESTCRSVPLREKLTAIGNKNIRGLIGGFQQGSGASGGVQFTTLRAIPDWILRADFLVSTKQARRADFESFIPHVGSSRNHADVWFSYSRTVNNFFGIGPRIGREFKSDFTIEQRSYQALFYRDLAAHLQGGVYSQVVDAHTSRGRNKTDLPIDSHFSQVAGDPITQWAPGLFSFSKILSNGGYLLYDTRDNSVGFTRGMQLYGRVASYDGLKNHGAFDDYGWNEAEYDVRGYIPLGGPKTSLAVRSRGQFKTTKGGSTIPFYDLSWLGGREYVRGYETYRFRGNNILMAAAELRRTVQAKSDTRGIDVFVFTDSGQVWGDSRSDSDPQILQHAHLNWSNWHSSVGGGIQYRRSRRLAGRFEVGHSNEGNLVYASMTRGF